MKLFAAIFLISNLSFAGIFRPDMSQIQSQLDELASDGYECRNIWPEAFYMSRLAAAEEFELGYECKKEGSPTKNSVITYQADAAVGARCRNATAVSIKEGTLKKSPTPAE